MAARIARSKSGRKSSGRMTRRASARRRLKTGRPDRKRRAKASRRVASRRASPRRGQRRAKARAGNRSVTVSLQIVSRGADDLLAWIKRWVEEEAHTLYFTSRRPKLRLEHKSPRYPGYIELARRGSLLTGEARAPRGMAPWGVVEKFVGRVIDKLNRRVSSLNIQIHSPD